MHFFSIEEDVFLIIQAIVCRLGVTNDIMSIRSEQRAFA